LEELNLGSLPSNKNVRARDIEEDRKRFLSDSGIADVYSLFGRYPYIDSLETVSKALKISLDEANERMDCLKNLSLVAFSEDGYRINESIEFKLDQIQDKDLKVKRHLARILQISAQIKKADRFSDRFLNACSTLNNIEDLMDDLNTAVDKFLKKNESIPSHRKDFHISLTFANAVNDISLNSNEVNNEK